MTCRATAIAVGPVFPGFYRVEGRGVSGSFESTGSPTVFSFVVPPGGTGSVEIKIRTDADRIQLWAFSDCAVTPIYMNSRPWPYWLLQSFPYRSLGAQENFGAAAPGGRVTTPCFGPAQAGVGAGRHTCPTSTGSVMNFVLHRRPVRSMAVVTALVLGGPLAVAGAAQAAPDVAAAPGDNGTVKIHRVGTDPDDRRHEPKVCRFYIAAFNFDPEQELDYRIVAGPSFKGEPASEGSFAVDADGDGPSGNLSLPDGQYKLFVTFAGQNGGAKQKLFKVNCPGGSIPGGDANGGVDDAPGGVGGVHTGGGGTAPRSPAR